MTRANGQSANVGATTIAALVILELGIVTAPGILGAAEKPEVGSSPTVAEFFQHPDVRAALPPELWREQEATLAQLKGAEILKALSAECDRLAREESGSAERGKPPVTTPDKEAIDRLSVHLNVLRTQGWDSVPAGFLADAESQSRRYRAAFELLHQFCERTTPRSTIPLKLDTLWLASVRMHTSLRADVVAALVRGDQEAAINRLRDWCGLSQRALASGESLAVFGALQLIPLQANFMSALPVQFDLQPERWEELPVLMISLRPEWDTLRAVNVAEFRAFAATQLKHVVASQDPSLIMMRARRLIDEDPEDNASPNPEERQMTALLQGHPHPVDLKATLAVVAQLWSERLNNERMPFPQGRLDVARQAWRQHSKWPRQFSFAIGGWRDDSDIQVPLTPSEVERLRGELKSVPNVLGLALIEDLLEYCGSRVSDRTQRQAMVEVDLAIQCTLLRVYEQRVGRAPRDLETLVIRGRRAAPHDPFGTRYHYSPDRRLLWSNGPDGRDDDGAPPLPPDEKSLQLNQLLMKWHPDHTDAPPLPELRSRGEDIVLPVPPVKRRRPSD